jgi:hypothetical protein
MNAIAVFRNNGDYHDEQEDEDEDSLNVNHPHFVYSRLEMQVFEVKT